MILTKEINIKITDYNYNYYENLGYDISYGEDLIIPVALLSKGSNYKIICQCDNCYIIKDVIFKNYIKYNNDWGVYYCRKCSEKKRKSTLKENYGVEYPIQSTIIKNKMEETMMDRYGVINISTKRKSD